MRKTTPDAATYVTPWDGTPLYGEGTTYGSSGYAVHPCLACSSPDSQTLVTLDTLEDHAERHARRYAEWQAEQAAAV